MQPIEISPSDKERAEALFPGSPFQQVTHNHLLSRLHALRNELETVTQDGLREKQGQVAEVKRFLGYIHQNDSPAVKEIYG